MNLPNAITIGRILAAPLVAWLPFASSWTLRLLGFVLFVAVAVSDYYDGMIARTRNLVTNLGKQLDPLADKLFLVATFVPMYVLMEARATYPFQTPFGTVGFPVWIALIILGRELFMIIFRQIASRRGVVIAAIGPAKWKTGFQLVWAGAAYFWFWAATAAEHFGWQLDRSWRLFAAFNGVVGVVTMIAAMLLTVYSLVLYLRRYGGVLATRRGPA